MSLFDQVSKDIIAAMKAKDKVRLEALRNIKKYFIEAKTAPGANDTLADDAALKILAKLAKQGRDTAALYREQNRPDLAEEEEQQAAVIESYLPKALTPEELEAEVKAIIAEVGATSPKEMGKVMGVASKRLAGRADGKAISELVKRLLAQ
ncbi:MAG: GatB/YqeY domain-containing protein [Bacteroidales bacterium]|nr:GatB/YqeY domain-containing protein [Bacteroidales bacterium]